MSVGLSDGADALVAGGARPLRGRLRIPGDKSISHRALIFAALAQGASTITNLATGADVRATARVLAQLGVTIGSEAGAVVVHGTGAEGLTEAADVL
ncbi:MAG TPA: 3-phosphoshikimate 1-carboxyvinyltransferase, partial [Acidimicrobiia bacterium]